MVAIGALIFIGGVALTIIEVAVWFVTGRLSKIADGVLWMNLPLDLTALMTGAVIGVTGALVVHR